MAIEFRGARFAPLHGLTVSAPNGSVIGVVGEKGAGKAALLRLASGAVNPEAGEVIADGERRYLGPLDALQLSPVDVLLIEHSLAHHDALVRARAVAGIDRLRSAGATVLIVSHELDLLQPLCDEVWWLDAGSLALRGDPRQVLFVYGAGTTEKVRA